LSSDTGAAVICDDGVGALTEQLTNSDETTASNNARNRVFIRPGDL